MIAGRWRAMPGVEPGSEWIVARYVNLGASDAPVGFEPLCDSEGYVRMFANEALADAAVREQEALHRG